MELSPFVKFKNLTREIGNGYREITNRLVNKENQRNILEIIEAIKEEDVKKKYLTEQNAMIPQVSEKRVRKQIDN